jgi:hypothetical protein
VHDGDLPGGPAKADEAELEQKASASRKLTAGEGSVNGWFTRREIE